MSEKYKTLEQIRDALQCTDETGLNAEACYELGENMDALLRERENAKPVATFTVGPFDAGDEYVSGVVRFTDVGRKLCNPGSGKHVELMFYTHPPKPVSMPDVIDAKYGNVLRPFVRLMANELHANAGKGDRPGWLSMTREVALLEIYYHLAKLQKAMKRDTVIVDEVQEYAADVANMAMMALDICGGLEVEQQAPAAPAGTGKCSLVDALDFLEMTASNGFELHGDDALRLRAIADKIAPATATNSDDAISEESPVIMASGENLDKCGEMFGIRERNPGESDSAYRKHILDMFGGDVHTNKEDG